MGTTHNRPVGQSAIEAARADKEAAAALAEKHADEAAIADVARVDSAAAPTIDAAAAAAVQASADTKTAAELNAAAKIRPSIQLTKTPAQLLDEAGAALKFLTDRFAKTARLCNEDDIELLSMYAGKLDEAARAMHVRTQALCKKLEGRDGLDAAMKQAAETAAAERAKVATARALVAAAAANETAPPA